MSTLANYGKKRGLRNPKMPARVPWQSIVQSSKAHEAQHPVSVRAFTGFVPLYAPGSDPIGQGKGGIPGRRRAPMLCEDVLVKNIFLDDPLKVNDALNQMKNFNLTIDRVAERGIHAKGAPFGFGMTPIWSKTQLDHLASIMKAEARVHTDNIRKFYSDREWGIIDQHLENVGDYAVVDAHAEDRTQLVLQGKYIVDKLVPGDTYLHLALRVNAVEASVLLLQYNIDPAAVNDLGEGAPDLLPGVYDYFMKEFKILLELKYRAKSLRAKRLDRREDEKLANELETIFKWEKFHDMCQALTHAYYDRSLQIATLEHRAWKASLEDLRIEERAYEVIATKSRVSTYIKKCQEMHAMTEPEKRPGFEAPPVIPSDVENDLVTLSTLSFVDDKVMLDTWFSQLESGTIHVQAAWRGFRVRKRVREVLRNQAATIMQSQARAFIAKRKMDTLRITRRTNAATRLQARVRGVLTRWLVADDRDDARVKRFQR